MFGEQTSGVITTEDNALARPTSSNVWASNLQ